jgi:hypothetical protein
MLEAPLYGTIVCTDETVLAEHYFSTSDFVTFSDAASLKTAIRDLLADETLLSQIKLTAHARALSIASDSFWHTVEAAIRANELPTLTATATTET